MPLPVSVDTGTRPRVTRASRWWLGGVVFLVHTLSPIPQSGDSRLSAITAWQFLNHFSLDLRGYDEITTLTDQGDLVAAHGHLLPFFPWPPMLLAIPADLVVAAASALSGSSGTPTQFFPGHTFFVEVPTASLLVAITTVLIRELVRGLPTSLVSARAALLTALLFAFGTSAWSVASRALWQQTVSMLVLTVALLALQRVDRSTRWPLLLGLSMAVAVAVRPTNAVVVVLLAGLIGWEHRSVWRPVAVGAVAGALPFLLYSRWQYGTFVPPYYRLARLADPARYGFGESLLVNLLSPARGLLFFDPVILLAAVGLVLRVRRRMLTPTDVVLALAVVGQLLVIGKYGSTGGYTYGPRLMVDILPMLMVLAAPTLTRFDARPVDPGPARSRGSGRSLARYAGTTALVLLIAWSVFVNASGALSRAGVCWNSDPVSVDVQPARVWDLSDPQFLRPARALLSGESLHDVVLRHC